MSQPSTACKNCGSTLAGNFCQNCGQKADIHRVTFKHLAHEFFHAITHADKGFLYLVKELSYRPGHVASEYLEGKRKIYFNPLTFFVLASAIWALAVSKSHYFESMASGYTRGSNGANEMPEWLAYYFSQSMPIIVMHGKIISLIITAPLLAFLTWLFFHRRKVNYSENLVLHAFLVGYGHLIMVFIFIPAFLLLGHAKLNNNVYQWVFASYLALAYWQFFKSHWLVTIIKAAVIHFLFMILFWVPIFAVIFLRDHM
jgi:Protein of unknown function (DUF3667)